MPKTLHGYSLGDLVKVHEGVSNASRRYAGQIGQIIEIDEDDRGCYLDLDIDKEKSGFWLNEVTLVKKPQPKEYGIVKFCKEWNK
jgi:hypothetical protein